LKVVFADSRVPSAATTRWWLIFIVAAVILIGFGRLFVWSHPSDGETILATTTSSVLAAARGNDVQLRLAFGDRSSDDRSSARLLPVRSSAGGLAPGAAIDRILVLGPTNEAMLADIVAIMGAWAARDPRAAWIWFEARAPQFDSSMHASLTKLIFDALARRDPNAFVALMNSLVNEPRGPFSSSLIARIGLQSLVNAGAIELAEQTIEAWTGGPIIPEIDGAAYASVALAQAKTAPVAAGEWLKALPVTPATESAIVTFAADMGSRDPLAAMAWADTLPPGENKTLAINSIFGDWAQRDGTAAGEWLGLRLSAAPMTNDDDKIMALVNRSRMMQDNPTLALDWTRLISDPTSRATFEENILLRWARTDPAAAFEHLPTMPPLTAQPSNQP
jgi:hypothetical protein